jgi:hypothetical protein
MSRHCKANDSANFPIMKSSGWLASSGASNRGVGIIYLDLPNRLRYIPEVNRLLATIFEQHADSINLETSLVTIGEDHIVIQHDRQAHRTTLVHQSG